MRDMGNGADESKFAMAEYSELLLIVESSKVSFTISFIQKKPTGGKTSPPWSHP